MIVLVIEEAGYKEALLGIRLSYNSKTENLHPRSILLASQDSGHNKFLESIVMWLDITAPRFWWQQFDTYRAGVTKQSQSTMHTLYNHTFIQDNFETYIPAALLDILNKYKDQPELKGMLPESFLQRRIVCTNYKVIRHIIKQRFTHKLKQWQHFIYAIHSQCSYPEYLNDLFPQEEVND